MDEIKGYSMARQKNDKCKMTRKKELECLDEDRRWGEHTKNKDSGGQKQENDDGGGGGEVLEGAAQKGTQARKAKKKVREEAVLLQGLERRPEALAHRRLSRRCQGAVKSR